MNTATLIAQYEAQKVTAERRLSDAKSLGDKYLKALEATGIDKMTPEQSRQLDEMRTKRNDAVAQIRQADGAIKALREAEADDAEYLRKASESHSTGASLNVNRTDRAGRVSIGSEAHTYRAPAERNNSLPNGEVEP